ncbi:MAG: COX15/CtaA family protein [Acidimicrobiia bacterium]
MPSLARYAWFVLIFNVVVILLGGLVRATGSGAGCGPSWPACQGELTPELVGPTAIEFTHRAFSGAALILVVVLAVLVWRDRNKGHPARLGAGLSVVAIVIEALIGALIVVAEWVASDTSVARVVSVPLHLVNTLFLLAALTLTAFWLSGGRPFVREVEPRVKAAVIAGGLALVVVTASGAVTALADTLFPKDPFSFDYTAASHFLTRLRIAHPILAVLAAASGWWLSIRWGQRRSSVGRSLVALVAVLLVTGALNVFLGTPLWLQLTHLALADALWVTYVLASAGALQERVSAPV